MPKASDLRCYLHNTPRPCWECQPRRTCYWCGEKFRATSVVNPSKLCDECRTYTDLPIDLDREESIPAGMFEKEEG